MRLKKIPKNTRFVAFINHHKRADCTLFLQKKAFLYIPRGSFKIIDSHNFFCAFPPMKEFPQWQLYSNLKIEVEFK